MLLVVEGPMNRARAAGFSLIELLIVVGFVSVLAAMSGPPIQAGMGPLRPPFRQPGGGRHHTDGALPGSGQEPDSQGAIHDPAAGQYRVLDAADSPVGDVQVLPAAAAFGSISGDLEIDPEGQVTPLTGPSPATIVVSNGDTDQDRTITVSGSGRVQVP